MAALRLVVIAVAAGLGVLVGLGAAAVLAALSAMFCLMASFGGTLRAWRQPSPVASSWRGPFRLVQDFTAPAVAVIVVVRTLAGMRDPDVAARTALAGP